MHCEVSDAAIYVSPVVFQMCVRGGSDAAFAVDGLNGAALEWQSAPTF